MSEPAARPDQPLADLYDRATLAKLGLGGDRDPDPRRVATGWRARLATGALVSALGAGLAETYDPAPRRPRIVEVDPGDDEPEPLAVTLHFVPGDPRATVVVVRPWLLAS